MSELWQPWERLFLHEVGMTMPVPLIAEKLERTPRAIVSMAARIEAPLPSRMKGRPWTEAELFLFGHFSNEEIAVATNRSIYSVRSMKRTLLNRCGGEIVPEWTNEELEYLWRNNNAKVAELTGRSEEEVANRRLRWNLERNGWHRRDPERQDD